MRNRCSERERERERARWIKTTLPLDLVVVFTVYLLVFVICIYQFTTLPPGRIMDGKLYLIIIIMKIIIYEMHKIKLKNTYRLLFYSCLFVNFNFLDVSDMFWLKNNWRLKKKKKPIDRIGLENAELNFDWRVPVCFGRLGFGIQLFIILSSFFFFFWFWVGAT